MGTGMLRQEDSDGGTRHTEPQKGRLQGCPIMLRLRFTIQ